ncbi:MAG: cation acetate symporter, partial [Gemmatimonadota bacterium]|nr:cation acetate symporter [Gemmatimonadota bacterium]
GMVTGVTITAAYIVYFALMHPELNNADNWWFGISPEGFGTVGMLVNFAITMVVSRFTPEPPVHVRVLVESIRIPRGAGEAHEISA